MNWIREVALVATGGAFGSVCRYLLSGLVLQQTINWRFPLPTFCVNVLGCLVIGLMSGLIIKWDAVSFDLRLLIITGVIGGFTTFSAFGLETFYLLRKGEIIIAASYVVTSVVVGLLALWLGFQLIPNKG